MVSSSFDLLQEKNKEGPAVALRATGGSLRRHPRRAKGGGKHGFFWVSPFFLFFFFLSLGGPRGRGRAGQGDGPHVPVPQSCESWENSKVGEVGRDGKRGGGTEDSEKKKKKRKIPGKLMGGEEKGGGKGARVR